MGIKRRKAQAQRSGLKRAGAFVCKWRTMQSASDTDIRGGQLCSQLLAAVASRAKRQHPALPILCAAEQFKIVLLSQELGHVAAESALMCFNGSASPSADKTDPRGKRGRRRSILRPGLKTIGKIRGHASVETVAARAAMQQRKRSAAAQEKTAARNAQKRLMTRHRYKIGINFGAIDRQDPGALRRVDYERNSLPSAYLGDLSDRQDIAESI